MGGDNDYPQSFKKHKNRQVRTCPTAYYRDSKGAGYDSETDPEAGHDFEIFNWQPIRALFQSVS